MNKNNPTCSCPESCSSVDEMCASCEAEYVAWSEQNQVELAYYAALERGAAQLRLILWPEGHINWNEYTFEPAPRGELAQVEGWPS